MYCKLKVKKWHQTCLLVFVQIICLKVVRRNVLYVTLSIQSEILFWTPHDDIQEHMFQWENLVDQQCYIQYNNMYGNVK